MTYYIINKILLFTRPWYYSLKVRLFIIKLFFSDTKFYDYKKIIENAKLSDNIKKNILKDGKPFADRLLLVRYCSQFVDKQFNAAAEFGVFKGETLSLISSCLPKKLVYGFDSFEGLPEAWGDLLPKGFFKTDIPKLRNKNIRLIKGLFQDSLKKFLLENKSIKFDFIHIDCDLYESTIYVLDNIRSNLNKKKFIIIFDEFYGYKDFEKYEFRAFKEFLSNNSYLYKCIGYSSSSAAFELSLK